MILFQMIHARGKPRVYTPVEVAWGVSCVSALEYAHLQAPCRTTYTTSTPDRHTEPDTDLGTNLGTNLGTHLGTDKGGVGEASVATVVTVTIGPAIVDMIDITRHLLDRATGIDQHHPERQKRRITII